MTIYKRLRVFHLWLYAPLVPSLPPLYAFVDSLPEYHLGFKAQYSKGLLMRGGFRPGAGRKAGEPTVRLRVPVGVLPAVQALIDAHKKSGSEIKSPETPVDSGLEVGSKIKQDGKTPALAEYPPKSVPSNARPAPRPMNAEQRQAMRDLEKFPKRALKQVRAKFGSLAEAVRQGVRVEYGGQAASVRPELVIYKNRVLPEK